MNRPGICSVWTLVNERLVFLGGLTECHGYRQWRYPNANSGFHDRSSQWLLNLILRLRLGLCLPLHVARIVGTTTLQRLDVVHYVSRTVARCFASGWARMRLLECVLRLGTALDLAFTVSGARGATSLASSWCARMNTGRFCGKRPGITSLIWSMGSYHRRTGSPS